MSADALLSSDLTSDLGPRVDVTCAVVVIPLGSDVDVNLIERDVKSEADIERQAVGRRRVYGDAVEDAYFGGRAACHVVAATDREVAGGFLVESLVAYGAKLHEGYRDNLGTLDRQAVAVAVLRRQHADCHVDTRMSLRALQGVAHELLVDIPLRPSNEPMRVGVDCDPPAFDSEGFLGDARTAADAMYVVLGVDDSPGAGSALASDRRFSIVSSPRISGLPGDRGRNADEFRRMAEVALIAFEQRACVVRIRERLGQDNAYTKLNAAKPTHDATAALGEVGPLLAHAQEISGLLAEFRRTRWWSALEGSSESSRLLRTLQSGMGVPEMVRELEEAAAGLEQLTNTVFRRVAEKVDRDHAAAEAQRSFTMSLWFGALAVPSLLFSVSNLLVEGRQWELLWVVVASVIGVAGVVAIPEYARRSKKHGGE